MSFRAKNIANRKPALNIRNCHLSVAHIFDTAGVDASPLMTWGTIEGTPFRLDAGDVSVDSSPGPTFKIPEPKDREVLAHKLAEKASKRHREERRQALAASAFGK